MGTHCSRRSLWRVVSDRIKFPKTRGWSKVESPFLIGPVRVSRIWVLLIPQLALERASELGMTQHFQPPLRRIWQPVLPRVGSTQSCSTGEGNSRWGLASGGLFLFF